jgi:hypothetical protein
MDNHDEKTWKEKLSEIHPQKSFSGLLRELNELGVDISYNGLKKQKDKHGIVKKEEGFFVLRVDTVLSLGLWKDMSGNPIVDYSAQGSGLKERLDIATVRIKEAQMRQQERADLEQQGELIPLRELNGRVLAPAVQMQKNIIPLLGKKCQEWVELVGGAEGKSHYLEKEIRLFLKENFARAYADKKYQLSIDPVKPQQQSLIDG